MLRALEDLARRVGLEVRVEETWKGGPSAGGLCVLRGKPLVLLDALAPLPERVDVLCEALSGFDLDSMFLPPALRARLQGRTVAARPSTAAGRGGGR
jgi:hypothetical protein